MVWDLQPISVNPNHELLGQPSYLEQGPAVSKRFRELRERP